MLIVNTGGYRRKFKVASYCDSNYSTNTKLKWKIVCLVFKTI